MLSTLLHYYHSIIVCVGFRKWVQESVRPFDLYCYGSLLINGSCSTAQTSPVHQRAGFRVCACIWGTRVLYILSGNHVARALIAWLPPSTYYSHHTRFILDTLSTYRIVNIISCRQSHAPTQFLCQSTRKSPALTCSSSSNCSLPSAASAIYVNTIVFHRHTTLSLIIAQSPHHSINHFNASTPQKHSHTALSGSRLGMPRSMASRAASLACSLSSTSRDAE